MTISQQLKLPRKRVSNSQNRKLSQRSLLLLLAVLVGLLCGCAAVILKSAVHLIQDGLISWFRSPADWMLYLVYPGIGMLLSLFFVRKVVGEDIGHGVTKVLQAVSKNESRISRRNTWASVVASSVTIGFGGSVGAEAPIVYTGAAIGSNVGRAAGMSYRNMTILLGCGAAAAIAGIFKAPLAGVLFALEILFFNISMASILPLLLSSVTATVVTYLFMGDSVVFSNSIETFNIANLPFYLVLGVFCGVMSLWFITTTLRVEDKMRRIRRPAVRWFVSALFLGLLIYLFPPLYGEGYDSLTSMMNNQPGEGIASGLFLTHVIDSDWLLVLFFAGVMMLKVYATALTNAGGGVGGTFGPTLVTGGLAGFVIASVFNLSGIADVPISNFVLVGMGGMMAGVMQAPMTAIFLIAEITGGYELLIPLIVASSVSFATTRLKEQYSIYTKRIAAKGELLTHDNDRTVLTLLRTSDFVEKDFTTVSVGGNLGDLVKAISSSTRNIYPVVDEQMHFCGYISLDSVRSIMFDSAKYENVKISSLMKSSPAFIYLDEKMDSVMDKFEHTGVWSLPVVDDENKYLGFVSKSTIFTSYREQLQEVSHE